MVGTKILHGYVAVCLFQNVTMVASRGGFCVSWEFPFGFDGIRLSYFLLQIVSCGAALCLVPQSWLQEQLK